MSQNTGTPNPSTMTCADFEACFDRYVDETLDAVMMNSCSCHIASCRPCDREVTRWQQTRILLSTAVADFSTAVDVSSVRSEVFAALGFAEDSSTDKRQSATREAAYDRGAARRSAGRSGRRAASGERRSTFGAVLRFASAATASAIAAAAAVMVISPSPQGTGTTQQYVAATERVSPATFVANNAVRPSGAGVRPASLARAARKNSFNRNLVAPAAYTQPPLARPEVSHVEGLEAGQDQRVATWVQQRTGARVIWVENQAMGAPIRTAGLSR